jgi:hypothetical protein
LTPVRVGDVLELQSPTGWAYAVVSQKHPRYGHLLRALRGIYRRQVTNWLSLNSADVAFSCFFPANLAVRRKIARVVGNVSIPPSLQLFPTFRSGLRNPNTGETAWWLWDGTREWRIEGLTPEQRKLPIRGVWNDTLLLHRIETGWNPEDE